MSRIHSIFAGGLLHIRSILSLIIFGSLVALVPIAAVPYGAIEDWWASLIQAIIFILAALWAVEGAFAGDWLNSKQWIALVPALLALYAFVQSWTVSYDPYETRLAAAQIAALALALGLLIRYASSERRLGVLVYTVIAVGLVSALFGIFRQTAQRDAIGFFLPRLPKGSGYAQFINRNHFPYLAEMALGLTLGLAAGHGLSRRKTLIYCALALPIWVALILCNSRGGVLAMLCQVIFLGATYGVTRWRKVGGRSGGGDRYRPSSPPSGWRAFRLLATRVVLAALLPLLIIIGMIWVGGDSLTDRMSSVWDEVASSSGAGDANHTRRIDIWKATWGMFVDHPLTGVGIGGYWIAVSGYHHGSGALVPQQSHNDYLELLASGGIIGFSLLPLFIYLLVRRARVRLREESLFARASTLGALTGILGVAAHSLVDFGLHVPINALTFIAMVAVAAADSNGSKQKPGLNSIDNVQTQE